MFEMRLFKRGKFYHVEYSRNRRISLRTSNKEKAKVLFNELEKAEIRGKLQLLDKVERISISEFINIYINDPDRNQLSFKTLQADELAFKLLQDVAGDIPLKLVSRDTIKQFKEASIRRVKPVSVNTYLRHIKAGLRWAKNENFITRVPVIKQYKLSQSLPRPIPQEDIKKILAYAKSHNYEMYRIIKFALFTGCRSGEIIRARYEHIYDYGIRIYGKGKKERTIRLLPQALSVKQNIGKIFRYTTTSAPSKYFKEITTAVNVKARFHDLRHTAGTVMLMNGIRLEIVQEILGHSNIKTTQIYAKVVAQSVYDEMGKMGGVNFE